MELLAYFLILWWAFLELSTIKGAHDSTVFGAYSYALPPPPLETTLDVTKFGAVGSGKTDDFRAFKTAWEVACQNISNSAKITVPSGKIFLVSAIEFGGPCKCHNIIFEILGAIVAPPKSAWKNTRASEWLKFNQVHGLKVVGNGQGLIDGQGDSWWTSGDGARPIAMLFSLCTNLQISGLKLINSPKFHISITGCNNANISGLHIIAPSTSPNTDGIDVSSSTNIDIQNCTMETGDDCIAIKGGTSNVTISEIACGPGSHGISIGSLGENGKHDQVEAINVRNCYLNGTRNGVRIKTWQGGSGFARNINFSQINFAAVNNPILINQFYCPHKRCTNKTSAVQVSDVRYVGLRGTSISQNAIITFLCSETIHCTNIILDDVSIKSIYSKNSASVVCLNAHGTVRGTCTPTVNCLLT